MTRLLRLGEVTAVAVPSVEQEAARDLVRARKDARGDLMRTRHRPSKLLLRQGIVYSGGNTWADAHDRWLRRQRFENTATTTAFESDYEAVLSVKAPRNRLDTAMVELAEDSEFTPVVHRLACLRGVSTLTAFALAVEIGDWHRFTGNSIGSFIGLVSSEHSSGASRVQGAITKTGSSHARRLLVEAAWHHRATYRPANTMRDRRELAPAAARQRGDAGNRRLHERWVTWSDPRSCYEQPTRLGSATLDIRHAEQLLPNSPSCGTQPANTSLTARRQRHAHHTDAATKPRHPQGIPRAPHPVP
ncbi:MAG: transposase [Pseudonocardiales bacterium]|nr:transposase [Pseudonocardiales bacterium]